MTPSPSTTTRKWSTEIPHTSRPDRGNIYRHADPLASPQLAFEGCYTLYEILRRGQSISPLGPCLGFRAVSTSGYATPYVYSSYTEVVARVDAFAAGLERMGLVETNEDGMLLLGLYLKNCMEWVLAEHAIYTLGGTTVPFYDTLGPSTVEFILHQTSTSAVICTREELSRLCTAKTSGNCPHFQNVILVDGVIPSAAEQASNAGLNITSFAKVEAMGAQIVSAEGFAHHPPSGSSIATFCYTSGTTGNPKGALLTHTNLVGNLCGLLHGGDAITIKPSDRHLSYMPLPHIFERVVQACVLGSGGSVAFYRGDPLLLIEDIQACRPTIFIAAPRVLSRIYDKILTGIDAAGGMKLKLFKAGLKAKTENLSKGRLTHPVYDTLLFNKIKAGLGFDHVRFLISGAAPLSESVMIFWRCMLGCPVVEGYGQTEGAASGTLGHEEDMATVGHVGGPAYPVEICLVDVPEMGYLHTDTSHQGMECCGRGEICIRGPNVFKGYYKEPEKTREAVDEEGWLHSGDIGMWMKQGQLKIIDRKKNIFKLAQGEYVAPEKIENIITQSKLISQCFVYGDSYQNHLVAIIVPDEEVIKTWATDKQLSLPFRELCLQQDLYDDIMSDIRSVANKESLMGFEVPKVCVLESELFSVENGLLTPTFKLKRRELYEKYEKEIEEMYSRVEKSKL